MPDYTAKRIDEMEAAFGGGMKKARAELGVSSFGFQVIDLPPNYADYPEHDHAEEAQEEVFAVIRGSGEMDVEGERVPMNPDILIRVGPAARRRIVAGPEGVRILALGAIPGKPYEIREFTELTGSAS